MPPFAVRPSVWPDRSRNLGEAWRMAIARDDPLGVERSIGTTWKPAEFLAPLLSPIVAGCLLACAFPPINWNDAVWIAILPFCIAVSSRNGLASYIGAYAGGFAFHLIGLDWVRTCYGSTGLAGPWALAWFVTAQVMAPTWLIGMALARLLYHRLRWPMSFAIAFAWTGASFVGQMFSLLATGNEFQLLDLSTTQVDRLWIVQCADICGAKFIGLLIVFANGALYDILDSKRHWKPAACCAAALALVAAYGSWRLHQVPSGGHLTACLMPCDEFPSTAGRVPDHVRDADVLLWPESALGDRHQIPENSIIESLERLATWSGAWVVIGIERRSAGQMRNSVAVVAPHRGFQGYYDKTCLVPWGEFNPPLFAALAPPLKREFVPGTAWPIFICAGARLAPLICNDVCFSRQLRRYDSPDVFVVSSCEDADATRALQTYVQQIARLRAIEFRRLIIRNAKGGICGAISGDGRVISSSQDAIGAGRNGQPIRLDNLPLDNRLAPYRTFGDWPLILGVACASAIALFGHEHRGKSSGVDSDPPNGARAPVPDGGACVEGKC
jgi:apolipoprotein N-acyltransferase